MSGPTLAGADKGACRPFRPVPGGIILFEEGGGWRRVPAALRMVRLRDVTRFEDYARQYLAGRGDGQVSGGMLIWEKFLLTLHEALVQDGAPNTPLFPLPSTLTNEKAKIDPIIMATLPLRDLMDGELERLKDEYDLLCNTEAPSAITQEQWEAIVREGKASSLGSLVSQYGSSALIRVLHGTPEGAWQK